MKIIIKLLNLFKCKNVMAKKESKHWRKYDEIMKDKFTKPTNMFGI